ncbi:MAG: ferredoxin--nitrite reductase [Cyanobacteriota bacterium]|nr:ferredoxin--nitrite reductase [Cyanobacteriota bacterium]
MASSNASPVEAPDPSKEGSRAAPLNKIEQAKASYCGLDLESRLQELAAAGWDTLDEATLTIHLKWLGIFFRPVTPGRFMVRLRLPNGLINADQLEALADVVDRCGEEGSADITTRQNLQLRGLLLEDMPPLLLELQRLGLTSRQSGHDNPRNVTGNPLAGLDPEEIVDTRPLVQAIQEVLLGPEGPRNLPRKFNVAVGGAPDSFLLHNDLAFLPSNHGEDPGFTVMVGGFFSGQRNELAIPLGLWLPASALPGFTLAVVKHFERGGDRAVRSRTRLMYLIEALGLEAYRLEVIATHRDLRGAEEAGLLRAHDGSHLVNRPPRDVCGIHPQKQAGFSWVGLNVPMGRLDAAAMADLAHLARTWGEGELRLTESQNVVISGVPDGRIDALRRELATPERQRAFPLTPGPLLAEAVSCTGNRYCSFALIPTKTTAQAVVEELERRLELPHPVRTHWTGCPNACGQPYMGQIGLMGAKARQDGQMVEAAKIFLDGSMGPQPRLAELHHKGVPLEQLTDTLEALLVERFGARRRPLSP